MNDQNLDRGISRRHLLLGLGLGATALAAGCTTGPRARILGPYDGGAPIPEYGEGGLVSNYGPIEDGGYQIPAINPKRVNPKFFRQEVADPTGEAPGTIVIDTTNRFAYLTEGNGRAMRYGIGVGREGFAWSGRAKVQWKRKWPRWTPPNEMIDRQPELEPYRNVGMDPGLMNPLGARALYLFQDGKDTLYRLHGTPQYWTIGTAASSGCVRFMNHDIIDLYDRAPDGAPVLVIQNGMV